MGSQSVWIRTACVQKARLQRTGIPTNEYRGSSRGFGPVERKPVRTKAQQNEIPIERNPIRTTTRQKESPTERKAQFEPVYNKLCVGTVFAASGNVTTET